jgi:transposase
MRTYVRSKSTKKGSSVDKESLELLLVQGLSVERIGKRFGKDASTVSYWMKKYRLDAVNREKHAARGGIERAVSGAGGERSVDCQDCADPQSKPATIRHWLAKYGLETHSTVRRRIGKDAREAGQVLIERPWWRRRAEHARSAAITATSAASISITRPGREELFRKP